MFISVKDKNKIEELIACQEHLVERFDGLRDYIKENPNPKQDYYWNKFEDLLAWSMKFDKNSYEYEKLSKTAWEMLDIYLEMLLTKSL